MLLGACTDDGTAEGDADTTGDGDDTVTISEDISEDTTWTADKTYMLAADTLVFVNGATLTIEPGTLIRGGAGSALVIEKDSRIVAEGTADAPIVFTSFAAENPAAGDWGGLVLLGEAVINLQGGVGMAEGFPIPPTYGGTDPAHDCGSLRYVRVEYAGFAISEGNELNGITFYACGTGTKASYLQSHMGLDDGIEFFGGAFDLDHIVVTGAADDSMDMDQGFSGMAQHVLIHQSDSIGDNCFEVSNQGSDFDATPKTSPMICNATCVGSGAGGEKSIMISNNIFFGILGAEAHASGADTLDGAGWTAWIQDPTRANLDSDPGLGSLAWGSPNVVPSGDVSGDGSGCGGTTYLGAVDPSGDDWTAASWINYKP